MSKVSAETKALLKGRMEAIVQRTAPESFPKTFATSSTAQEDEVAGCAQKDDARQAFRKIERLSLVREQSSLALRARLSREGFSEQATDEALHRAFACGLVDDLRYADVLIRSRLSQGRGVQGIQAELKRYEIDITTVDGWPERFCGDGDSEVERALCLLDRKPPQSKNKRDAAYRRLAQKGFGASVSSTAARLWVELHPD